MRGILSTSTCLLLAAGCSSDSRSAPQAFYPSFFAPIPTMGPGEQIRMVQINAGPQPGALWVEVMRGDAILVGLEFALGVRSAPGQPVELLHGAAAVTRDFGDYEQWASLDECAQWWSEHGGEEPVSILARCAVPGLPGLEEGDILDYQAVLRYRWPGSEEELSLRGPLASTIAGPPGARIHVRLPEPGWKLAAGERRALDIVLAPPPAAPVTVQLHPMQGLDPAAGDLEIESEVLTIVDQDGRPIDQLTFASGQSALRVQVEARADAQPGAQRVYAEAPGWGLASVHLEVTD